MPLSDVLHQDLAQCRIQRAFRSSRIPHAYLFTGPEGVGKQMFATRLATVLLCSDPREIEVPATANGSVTPRREACGRCTECHLMAADTHPDFHLIHRLLNRQHDDDRVRKLKAIDLSIDVIRQFVIAKVGLQPSLGRAKVFVIVDAERLSTGAQNALLKTLEEPPGHSYLILLAPSADSLLPTTRSRCQEIPFQALPAAHIQERLIEEHAVDSQAAIFLAELAQGSLGTAKRFLQYQLHELIPDLLERVRQAGRDPIGFGQFLSRASEEFGKKIEGAVKSDEDEDSVDLNALRLAQGMFIAMVSTILRDVQRAVVGRPPAALPDSSVISDLAGHTHTRAIGTAIRSVASAEYQISQNANTSLIFDAVGIAVGRGLYPRMETADH